MSKPKITTELSFILFLIIVISLFRGCTSTIDEFVYPLGYPLILRVQYELDNINCTFDYGSSFRISIFYNDVCGSRLDDLRWKYIKINESYVKYEQYSSLGCGGSISGTQYFNTEECYHDVYIDLYTRHQRLYILYNISEVYTLLNSWGFSQVYGYDWCSNSVCTSISRLEIFPLNYCAWSDGDPDFSCGGGQYFKVVDELTQNNNTIQLEMYYDNKCTNHSNTCNRTCGGCANMAKCYTSWWTEDIIPQPTTTQAQTTPVQTTTPVQSDTTTPSQTTTQTSTTTPSQTMTTASPTKSYTPPLTTNVGTTTCGDEKEKVIYKIILMLLGLLMFM